MKRQSLDSLLAWKNSTHRKPMILKGARKTGKTWLMKELGKTCYRNCVYFNFDEQPELKDFFITNKEDPARLIEVLSVVARVKIEPKKTLLILDEIQECPEALHSLKYFYEQANEYHIIAAGNLLGTLLAEQLFYLAGVVTLLNIYPLSFEEFLEAVAPNLYTFYCQLTTKDIIKGYFHNSLIEMYNYYLIIGGMPECVSSWIMEKSASRISQIQDKLIEIYKKDFAKHNSKIRSSRIRMVFNSIPSQLAKQNEKFTYRAIKSEARAREFGEAIEWLVSAGMVNRINNVSSLANPLSINAKLDSFKLFVFDTGLFKAMAGISNRSILLSNDFQFKGALTENFVLQQLKNTLEVDPYYYSDKNTEIDFVIQHNDTIIPLDVKAGENVKALSLKKCLKSSAIPYGIRLSKLPYKKEEKIMNLPLYLAGKIKDFAQF